MQCGYITEGVDALRCFATNNCSVKVDVETMHRLSKARFLEMVTIEERRGSTMDGMRHLIGAARHLLKMEPSQGNSLALELIDPLIGAMEDENKKLSRRAEVLWQAVLDLDGAELTNEQIASEQAKAALGEDWLSGAIAYLAKTWPAEEERDAILMELADLRNQVSLERSKLGQRQKEYQLAKAESLARGGGFLTQ